MSFSEKEKAVNKFNIRQRILGGDCELEYNSVSDTVRLKYCGLETVILPDYVEEIDTKAFYNSRTVKVVGGRGLRYICSNAFYNCNYLKVVDLSKCSELKCLCKTFNSCPNLTELILPDTLEVMDSTFLNCNGSRLSMRIPEGVREIKRGGLKHKVENEEVDTEKVDLSGIFKRVIFKKLILSGNKGNKENIPIRLDNCNIEQLVVKDMVMHNIHYYNCEINNIHCYNCEIKEVVILGTECPRFDWCKIGSFRAKNLKIIRDGTFFESKIDDIDIGNSLEKIGNFAFANSSMHTKDDYNLFYQPYLSKVGESAFNCCNVSSDKSEKIDLDIKVGVCIIGDSAFSHIHCSSIKVNGEYKLGSEVFRGVTAKRVSLLGKCEFVGEKIIHGSNIEVIYLPKDLRSCPYNILGNEISELKMIYAPIKFKSSLDIYGVEVRDIRSLKLE